MNPTDEQSHILSQSVDTSSNLMINALAGTGKTTTLEMIERKVKTRPILYLVFNKRNADEAEKRMLSTTTVRTFNSMGHRVWTKTHKSVVNPRKTQEIYRAMIDEVKDRETREIMWDVMWDVINAVAMAKAVGYIPSAHAFADRSLLPREAFHATLDEIPDDLTSDLVEAVLSRSIAAAYKGNIDFNDQIYMPTLFGGTFPRFPLVKVDEYQDLSPINHAMLDKLARDRLIGVGDPWQNIYGFRGAKQGGMAEARQKFGMTDCDLSISFRCPQAIVEHARWRVPHFKWTKSGGSVHQPQILSGADIEENAAIICRNNAPLFSMALRLLSAGRSVSVAGSDIGPKLIALMKKLGPESLEQDSVLGTIDDWLLEKEAKGSKVAWDQAECMRVFASHGSNLAQAISYAEHLFKQQGTIRLTTGHKAKGLEWDTVYHLAPSLLGADEQDLNLRYVITTRSRNRLVEIEPEQINW